MILRNVKTNKIIFEADDITKVLDEFKKYPLYEVSIERHEEEGIVI